MKIEIIIGVLLIAGLVYAWYNEMRLRREAEIERDLGTRKVAMDGIAKKLEESKVAYDEAKKSFLDAPIPPHMFEHLGKPDPVGQFATKTPDESIDTNDPRFHRPGLDPSPSGETPTPSRT